LHLGYEEVTSAWNSSYRAIFAAAFAQYAAQSGDVLVEVVFFDDGVRPDSAEELFFLKDFSFSFYQEEKGVEDLGGKGDMPAPTRQEKLPGVEPIVSKLVYGKLGVAHRGAPSLQKFSETFRTV
jgi:hypothetical protein